VSLGSGSKRRRAGPSVDASKRQKKDSADDGAEEKADEPMNGLQRSRCLATVVRAANAALFV